MNDTTPVTTAIATMIRNGTTEQQIVAAVAHLFPNLTRRELVAAAQDAAVGHVCILRRALAPCSD